MIEHVARPDGPEVESFEGNTLVRQCKRLFFATRPKFYPASVLPVLAGTAWGVSVSDSFDIPVFALALLATVLVHAASNVLNDVGDDQSGTDRRNQQRIYPYTGGSRFIQSGILGADAMLRLGLGLVAAAIALGAVLLWLKGPMILVFGLSGLGLGIVYSLGPLRLSALGVGELAVAIGCGILPVMGSAWLQQAPLDAGLFLFSLPVSAWVMTILLINEVPDIGADAQAGKRTLPVRTGLGVTALVYLGSHLAAAAAVLYLSWLGALPPLAPLVPVLLLGLSVRSTRAIRAGIADRAGMTRAIEGTLAVHTVGTLWLTGCALYAVWFGGSA